MPEIVQEHGCSQYILVLRRPPVADPNRKFLPRSGTLFQHGGTYAQQDILVYIVLGLLISKRFSTAIIRDCHAMDRAN